MAPKGSSKPKTITSIAGSLLFGQGSNRIDLPSIDFLAKGVASKQIGKSQLEILEVLSVLQSALGDPRHSVPPQQGTVNPSIFDGYSARFSDQMPANLKEGWTRWLTEVATEANQRKLFEVYEEAIRTLAMIRPSLPSAIDFCLNQIDEKSHPTSDISALCTLAQCQGRRSDEARSRTAVALLGLHDKVRARGLTIDKHWGPRLTQLLERLIAADPGLANAIVQSKQFGLAEHLLFAQALPSAVQQEAQKKFRAKMFEIPPKQWSPSVVLYACKSGFDNETRKAMRAAIVEPSIRSTVVELLAKSPTSEDYSTFVAALGSTDRSAWSAAWNALGRLPNFSPEQEIIPLLSLLVRTEVGSSEVPRAKLVERLRKDALALRLGQPSSDATVAWLDWALEKLPPESTSVLAKLRAPQGQWLQQVAEASKLPGDAARGRLLYNQTKCAQCHGGGNALGPDLAGISKRFSREDLFRAIYEPSRDISDRYRAMRFLKDSGEVFVGMVVQDTAEGLPCSWPTAVLKKFLMMRLNPKPMPPSR